MSPRPTTTGPVGTGLPVWLTAVAVLGTVGCGDDESTGEQASELTAAVSAGSLGASAIEAVSALAENGCLGTPLCTYRGQCTSVDDECRATTAEQCRAALACRDWGECGVVEGRCAPGSDEDCRQAWNCKLKGRCSKGPEGCMVGGDGDCRRSELCKYHRKCSAHHGRCVKEK
ncbi:MAG: hypothetical protein JRI68_21560 [Deltaproteobacteria bacterium]|nr:hypothetical protein [Deltaproteobacteria bacterium]